MREEFKNRMKEKKKKKARANSTQFVDLMRLLICNN